MKKLYLFFYVSKNDVYPTEKKFICDENADRMQMFEAIKEKSYSIVKFMIEFPSGKAEFRCV
jgi:hypothetical protein